MQKEAPQIKIVKEEFSHKYHQMQETRDEYLITSHEYIHVIINQFCNPKENSATVQILIN